MAEALPSLEAEGPTPALVVVALGASAGGLKPLMSILSALPDPFRAAVIVAQHTGPGSVLPTLLQSCCVLPVTFAVDGETACPSHVYVCPPSHHIVVNSDRTFSVREASAGRRPVPSVDWLFQTLASSYAENAIVAVLSGTLRDGTRGIGFITDAGGMAMAQDPATCDFPDMAISALQTKRTREGMTPEQIGAAVVRAVGALDVDRLRRDFDYPFYSTN